MIYMLLTVCLRDNAMLFVVWGTMAKFISLGFKVGCISHIWRLFSMVVCVIGIAVGMIVVFPVVVVVVKAIVVVVAMVMAMALVVPMAFIVAMVMIVAMVVAS